MFMAVPTGMHDFLKVTIPPRDGLWITEIGHRARLVGSRQCVCARA
eukprot:COSAG05_NODE_28_length_29121_cov_56.951933_6_plen_46_part_00